jgi:hypothetical protein
MRTCETCRWWKDEAHQRQIMADRLRTGQCRRYPPLPVSPGNHGFWNGRPQTVNDYWCGEHTTKETDDAR